MDKQHYYWKQIDREENGTTCLRMFFHCTPEQMDKNIALAKTDETTVLLMVHNCELNKFGALMITDEIRFWEKDPSWELPENITNLVFLKD